jgi:hypothetical protein
MEAKEKYMKWLKERIETTRKEKDGFKVLPEEFESIIK